MKIHILAFFMILLFSCSERKENVIETAKGESQNISYSKFQTILDSAKVEGSILVYDLNENNYYSNDFEWALKGYLPASTFKIPNSIIALETSVVENDSTLFKWDGEQRSLEAWEQDLIFKDAFHASCVPCYQEVAIKIGAERMIQYLEKLKYGNMKVDSSNLQMFWLEGDSKISQFEQIDFLNRFYHSELPISKRTASIMKRMIVVKANDKYVLSGKTGWSIRNGNNNGWFVGYIELKNRMYFFATNIRPKEQFDMSMFPMIRKDITYKALKEMDVIE